MNPARLSLTTLRVAVRSSNRHIQRRGLATLSSEPVNVVAEPKPSSFSPLQDALAAKESRNNWTKAEIESIYNTGALELAFAAVCIPVFRNIGNRSGQLTHLLLCVGNNPPPIPQPILNPDVHAHEYQNRWLQ